MEHDVIYNNSQRLEDMVRLLRVLIKNSYNSNVESVSREIQLRLQAL